MNQVLWSWSLLENINEHADKILLFLIMAAYVT